MRLTCENVTAIVKECLFGADELPKEDRENWARENGRVVQGVLRAFGFHAGRIEENKKQISKWLDQLPEKLNEGCSFLELCVCRDGVQWGEHRNMDELICLGLAVNEIEYCAPREMWPALPGGMPYIRRIKSDEGKSG